MNTIKRAAVVFCFFITLFTFQGIAGAADINIGFSGPLTGPAAYIGIDSLHGALIAAKEINDAGGAVVGGTKYTVKIHQYDDEGNAAKAVAGLQRLKDKYNVPVVIQSISAAIMGAMEKNEKMNVILTGFFKLNAATQRGNKLILRHQQPSSEDAKALAQGTVRVLAPKAYAMISDVGDYGKNSVEVYKETFEKLGVKLVANEWLDMRTQTDFRGQLTKIKAANPDVIMLSAYDEASAGVIKQAHELGMKTPFAVSSGFQAMGEKLTGPALIEGYLKLIEPYDAVPPRPALVNYKTNLYPAMGYKEPAGPYGLNIYQVVHLMVMAMQKAGTTTDAWKIREAAPKLFPIPEKITTFGIKGWKEDGDGIIDNKIGRYSNGKLVEVK